VRTVIKLLVYAIAVWLAVQLVDGLRFDGTWIALAGIAAVLAVVNAVVKPVMTVLSFPLIILTLGIFVLVVNAVMLALTIWLSGLMELGLTSDGFGATFLGALVISVVVWLSEAVLKDER
jgi:putative membrane protein